MSLLFLLFAGYGLYIGITWLRYGTARNAGRDALLDQFMPQYEVAERHSIRVSAPAEVTFPTATACDFRDSLVIRSIFRAREILLGARGANRATPRGILEEVKSLGWGVLAEVPGREVVVGAITRPWEANVVFQALPSSEFARFRQPGYAKIAWTLRADPVGAAESIAITETRVMTTDAASRAKFRRYWAFLSPGILIIRKMMLRQVKRQSELARR